MTPHLVAVAAAVGAAWSVGPPLPVVVAVAAAALGRRTVVLLLLATVVVVGWRGEVALAGLSPPAVGSFDGWVMLVDDPRPSGPVGVVATVRHRDRRLTATAHGPVAGRLDDALAGERVRLIGTVRPVSADDDRSRWRHVVGRISVDAVEGHEPGPPVTRFANAVRRTLADGASSLERADRAVFLGMVIGDDRGQAPVVADDFRAAGLGHLLVVSGQNVAFVLAVAAPLVNRCRPAGRLLVLVLVLGLFALVTRFEPSVLRAVAMAGVALGGAVLGHPVDGRRGLSWAVAGLLVVDPFLVHQIAFRLSVAATAGIVWLGGPLAARLPLPAPLAVAVATTAAAQLGVAPVLLTTFGPLPLASLPANVVAGPASGAVMVWGCTVGLVAGMAGGPVAQVLHLPTRVMLWWIGEVAATAAAAPPATLGGPAVAGLGLAVLVALVAGRRGRAGAAVLGLVIVLGAAATAPSPPQGPARLDEGLTLWTSGPESIVVLDDPPAPRRVLERLRRSGAAPPALIVALDGDRADADAVMALRDRYGPVAVAAPPLHRVPGARTVAAGQVVALSAMALTFTEVEPSLVVVVSRGPPRGLRPAVSR